MNGIRIWLISLAAVASIAGGAGYFLGHSGGQAPPAAVQSSPAKPDGKGRILYYRAPMSPDTSPVPKKDSMGMDYIPVYEGEGEDESGTVAVSAQRMQMLGVRTVTVQTRTALARTIRATGTVEFDERRLATVTTKAGGWIEKLNVAATGEFVRAGEPLAEIYSPDLTAAEQEYLVVASMPSGSQNGADGAILAEAAARRLRALDVPESEIRRLQRTGKAARRIAVLAPANGVVTEKDAVLGMRVDPGTPLYKTADLATVWLIAQVQEQDLGPIGPGQKAHASFVAFPGRRFDGSVDFIYPTLSADTRTAKVRIVVPNGDYLLRADMYATVEIEAKPAGAAAPMIVVPDSAVIDSGERQAVLVVKGRGLFEPRAVHTGAHGDGYTQILAGVKPGEQVVTSANFLIDSESNLRAALQSFEADAKKNGSAP